MLVPVSGNRYEDFALVVGTAADPWAAPRWAGRLLKKAITCEVMEPLAGNWKIWSPVSEIVIKHWVFEREHEFYTA